MQKMRWTQITITTTYAASEAITHFLIELGANGVHINDMSPLCPPTSEVSGESHQEISCSKSAGSENGSPLVTLTTHFPTNDMLGEQMFKLREFLNELQSLGVTDGPAHIEFQSIEDENWGESWKSLFPPQQIGKRLLISPQWNKITPTPEQVVIWLDPGMAFGTGYHPTTQLALRLLESVIVGGEAVADIGTGSGILAITAVKLGARKVTATDIDEKVIPIAQENARINGVEECIEVFYSDYEALHNSYDIIVINILTKIIVPLIPDCIQHLHSHGTMIFSGVLKEEMSEVNTAVKANGLKIVTTVQQDDWIGVLVAKGQEG